MQFTQTKWMKDYFSFTKKERNAIIILGALALLFSLLPTLFPFLVKNDIELVVDTVAQRELEALKIIPEKNENLSVAYADADLYQPKESRFDRFRNDHAAGELFFFDPNTASATDWKRLGLRDKTVQTILKYRSKGGKFYKPEDLQKIYGLREEEYKRLIPYVQLGTSKKRAETPATATVFESRPERKETFLININQADTAQWKQLKGIGSAYAKRIVNFRNKLGGFVSVNQVAETYGLPDSVFQKIKTQLQVDGSAISRININSSTVNDLKAHPYISFPVANAIVQYRSQHGQFSAVTDLRKIMIIDEPLFQKINPYLTVE